MDKATRALAQRVTNLEKIVGRLDDLVTTIKNREGATSSSQDAGIRSNSGEARLSNGSKIDPTSHESKKSGHFPPKWKTYLEGVGIFCGIGYAIITGLQWHDLRANFKVDERAWLGPVRVGGDQNPLILENQPVVFMVEIGNSGKTPALKVATKVMTHTIKFGEPFVARYAPLTDQPGGKSVIQPGMKTYLRTEPTEIVTKQALDSLRTRSGVLYVFGEILYDDIFNEHHRTTFCYFMHQSLAGFSACDTYNDAD